MGYDDPNAFFVHLAAQKVVCMREIERRPLCKSFVRGDEKGYLMRRLSGPSLVLVRFWLSGRGVLVGSDLCIVS